jgi:hypothetical protein
MGGRRTWPQQLEFGDFAMVLQMLQGIKTRAESLGHEARPQSQALYGSPTT